MDVLLSSVTYILSGEDITAVFTISSSSYLFISSNSEPTKRFFKFLRLNDIRQLYSYDIGTGENRAKKNLEM